MTQLRDYQQDLDDEIERRLKRVKRLLVVSATGSGKTILFAHRVRAMNRPTAVIVHRKEILAQISCALSRSMELAEQGIDHRIVAPIEVVRIIRRRHLKMFQKSYVNQNSEVGVVSVQTLTAKSTQRDPRIMRWVERVRLVILDEAHHYVKDGKWGRALSMLDHATVIGYTATPERSDGKGLGSHADGFAEDMVVGPSLFDLIQAGWAPPFRYHCPKTDLNLKDIPITASGDVNTRRMRVMIEKSQLVGDVVKQYHQFAHDLPAIVFANDVKTAHEIAAAFQATGVNAVALSGDTDPTVREREIEGFANGTGAKVLVNVDLFDEGLDVPGAIVCIQARVTFSVAKYMQMCGRVNRPVYANGYDLSTAENRKRAIAAGSKPYAIVIDPVSNWIRCGAPTWPRNWTLDSVEKNATRAGKPHEERYRVCGNEICAQPYEMFRKSCPYCGEKYVPVGRDSIDQVDGELGELDLEASQALFAKLRQANMSDREFMNSLVVKNVPPAYRQSQLKRFQETKYRREVLKNYIAWWCGFQPHRGKSELERRFYYRFGIDMARALMLNAKDTDALMERIKGRFQDDIIDV